VNNALRAGIGVHEYVDLNPALEQAIEHVGIAWLKGRQGPQLYLAQVRLFAERKGKRWFYAQHGESIVGALLLNQVEVRQGWLVQFLMTTPEAPIGTSEQLVISALNTLRDEGCHFLSFGAAQGQKLGEIMGLGIISAWLARTAFKVFKKVFHLDKRRRYWRKFRPHTEPAYLVFSASRVGFREIFGVMRALNVFPAKPEPRESEEQDGS